MGTIDTTTINAIRLLSAEGIQKANSGHPGLPMGAAPMAYELWAKHMKHNPSDPNWINRDRFILSAGHGSMLLYSLLHLFGYGLTIDDLKEFRQWDSKTPGHPEFGHTVGVDTTTGPLGAGFATGIGMAMAEANLAANFNKDGFKIVDHYTYAIVGDGCMMEGITSEAASLAGTLKLGKFIALYDSNKITIEGSTDIAFTEDVAKRYEAYNWQVITVQDGNDLDAIGKALKEAKADLDRPSLIVVKTQIGYGCPAKQGKASAHGEPLGIDNIVETKKFLEFPVDQEFHVPEDVYGHMETIKEKGKNEQEAWDNMFAEYAAKYSELAEQWKIWTSKELPVDLLNEDDYWTFDKKPNATRAISGQIINRLTKYLPNMFGGAADLAPSTKTYMADKGDFSADNYAGMNLHFGVRELAMSAIVNGISLHGAHKPFCATFFVFSDYIKPSVRLSALMKLPVTFVLTHDSIGVGEDGPTHQPIEQLAMLRSIPNMVTYRPADAKETAAAWYYAISSKDTPTALVLTRQNLPYYEESGKEALKGGYVLVDSEKETPDMLLMASGSEVECIYEAAKKLKAEGIDVRVISMPSMDLYDMQSAEYKESVMPKAVRKRIAIEAGVTMGWYKYVGLDGKVIGLDHFGASAPAAKVFEAFGITADHAYDIAKKVYES